MVDERVWEKKTDFKKEKKEKKEKTDLLQNGTLGLVALFSGELLIGYYLCFYELNSNETINFLVFPGEDSLCFLCIRLEILWHLALNAICDHDYHNKKNYGMFDNCFFLLFFGFKNNFLFLGLENLFDNPK